MLPTVLYLTCAEWIFTYKTKITCSITTKRSSLDCEENWDYQIESELFDNKDYIINMLFQTCSLSSLLHVCWGRGELAVTLAMHQYDISLENKLLLQLYFYTFYNDLWKMYLTNRQVRLISKSNR